MDFMSEAQQFTKQILFLNYLICSQSLMLRMQAQNVLATQKNQIACSKSNPLLFLRIFSEIPSIKVLLSVWCPKNGYPLFTTITRHPEQKTWSGKLWMKCTAPKKQMQARKEKITFFEKHNRHSKTLRKKQMLKQDENA